MRHPRRRQGHPDEVRRCPSCCTTACGRPLLDWTLGAVRRARAGSAPWWSSRPTARAGRRACPSGQSPRSSRSGRAAPVTPCRCGRAALAGFEGDVLVLNADHPLTDPAALRDLAGRARRGRSRAPACSRCSAPTTSAPTSAASCAAPTAQFERIVELRDADAGQRALTEVNSGIYRLPSRPRCGRRWSGSTTDNDQGELYLTDVDRDPASRDGDRVIAGTPHDDPTVALGVNTRADLAEAAGAAARRASTSATCWPASRSSIRPRP